MNVQQACEAPRWQHMCEKSIDEKNGFEEEINGVLEVESRVPESVLEELRRRGHIIRDLGPWGQY